MFNKFFADANKKETISWALFDFANSSYGLLILSFVFPIFFKEVLAPEATGDLWWGLAVSLSILIGGLLSPFIGASADHDGRRKKKLVFFTVCSIVGTAFLYFLGPGMLLIGFILFVLTNICFEIAQTLYDSFLPHITTPKTAGRISGLGWGLGYLGGIAAMLLLKPLYESGYIPGMESTYKLTFPLVALFFLITALPTFIYLKDKEIKKEAYSFLTLCKVAWQKTTKTIKEVKQHKNIALFLAAFFLLSDALVTIFAFVPIYAKTTLGLTMSEIVFIMLIVQLIGFPAVVFFGWLSDHKGAKKILLVTIILWAIVVIGLALATNKMMFYAVAILTAFVIGASQAVARSWYSKMIPQEKRGEFFGFNGFANKIAATLGPVMFGIISTVTANQRIAMASLLIFLLIAFILFTQVKE